MGGGRVGIAVLLVNDEDLVRRALRAVLDIEPEIDVVDDVRAVREGVERLANAPDVAVLIGGVVTDATIEATRTLRGENRETSTRVLVLASRGSDRLAELIDAGASGLMLTSATPAELVCAVRMTAGGYAVLGPEVGGAMCELLSNSVPSAAGLEALEELSVREHEVLELVVYGKTNAEIAEALVVTTATVKSHVQRIFHKLALRDRTHAVIFAYESGLTGAHRRNLNGTSNDRSPRPAQLGRQPSAAA
jgi:DNA-binding NarL/FixJ family response regulator